MISMTRTSSRCLYTVWPPHSEQKKTVKEYESLPHLVLTSEELIYNPHDTSMARHDEALAKAVLETGHRIGALPPRRLCSVSKSLQLTSGADGVQLALE